MPYSHELVIPNKGLPFKLFLFEGKDGQYQREKHWHRSIEVFCVFSGSLDFYLNEEKYRLEPGELIIVNSNEIHSIYAPKPNLTVVLQIPQNVFQEYYTGERFIWFVHSSAGEDEALIELIRNMYRAYEKKDTGYELREMSLFYELQYRMVRHYRVEDVQEHIVKSSRKLERLSTITSYLKDNYSEDISLDRLAKIFGYSTSYLSRMFQKYAQVNYKDYLVQIRLEHAKQQLEQSEDSMTQIALDNGFPNSKAFASHFKRQYGQLPSVYRKKMNRSKK